jgi:hypothetical protein
MPPVTLVVRSIRGQSHMLPLSAVGVHEASTCVAGLPNTVKEQRHSSGSYDVLTVGPVPSSEIVMTPYAGTSVAARVGTAETEAPKLAQRAKESAAINRERQADRRTRRISLVIVVSSQR